MLVFVDMDGVLADFERAVKDRLGMEVLKDGPDPPGLWDAIRNYKEFYRTLPVMAGAHELWTAVRAIDPEACVLTGVPPSISDVATQKRNWFWERFEYAPVICCASRNKRDHGKRGDVLIDDREKHRAAWVEMGGIWITHRSVHETLVSLDTAVKEGNRLDYD